MILSSSYLVIIVITFAVAYLLLGRVASMLPRSRGHGLTPGSRELGWFLAGTHAPARPGDWSLPLASVCVPVASTRRSRMASRSPFSPAFGKSSFILPPLNEGQGSRRFWASVTSKPVLLGGWRPDTPSRGVHFRPIRGVA